MPIPGGSNGCASAWATGAMADTAQAEAPPRPSLSPSRSLALAALAGALAGTGQAPFGLLPLSLAGFVGAFILLERAPGPRTAAWVGWATGTAYFIVTLHWIVEPFFVDAARHGWMAPFAIIFLAGGLALFWAGAFWAARRVARALPALVFAWPALMTLAEWLRGWVFTGFPWATVGYIWTEWPAIQLAAWLGGAGLTLVTLLGAAIAGGIIAWNWRSPLVILAPLALTAVSLGGSILEPGPPQGLEGRPVVRIIQPNAPQHEKWDPEHVLTFYNRQLDFTARPAEGVGPELIVWPESAIPWSGEMAEVALSQISERARGTPVALGIQRLDPMGRYFNSMAVVGGGGEALALYDKHHLVPFGEYMPLASVAQAAGITGLAANDAAGFTPGPGPEVLDLGRVGMALPLICYELIFPRNIGEAAVRPDFLLHLTNDAWFGQTAGPQQHLAQARFRAVEQGLPVVRAANTGISAMIDARGRVLSALPLGQAGYLDAPLPEPLPPTFFARAGNLPVLVVAALLLVVAGALQLRRSDAVGD